LADIEAHTQIVGRLSDISREGCYVDTICPFAANAPVALKIFRGDQSFKTEAKVVYSQVGMGMGLLFTRTEPEQLRLLLTWLGEFADRKQHPPDVRNLEVQSKTEKNAEHNHEHNPWGILNELISVLRRKNVLNDSEAQNMLRKLSK
jgi:hypothetical protein